MQPSYAEIEQAREAIARHLRPTPLLNYPSLDAATGLELWVKHENHHAAGAFKVRGGVVLAAGLSDAERKRGLVTASTGNFGFAVAYAGKVTGTPVRVAVPEGANPTKVAAIRNAGAEVVFHGPDFDTAREWARGQAEERGARFVGPTDPEMIAGAGTYALEIFDEQPNVDTLVVPVGSGSGACGNCIVAHTRSPQTHVIAVQSEAAPAAYRSWKSGQLTEANMETVAEGLATRVAYANALEILRDPKMGLHDFALVSDDAMRRAVLLMLEHTHNLAEAAGAASLAGACARADALRGQKVVVIQSGGNLSPDGLRRILAWDAAQGGAA